MALLLAFVLWLITLSTVWIFIDRVWWFPELISEEGRAIDDQFLLTLVVVGITFFLAQMALGYFIWRFRARGNERAAYWHESPKLEATWTIATAIVFISLSIQGNRVWARLRLTEAPPDAIPIELTGQQFAWTIRYPGPDGKFGRIDPTLIGDSAGNPLVLDDKDPAAKDDIVVPTMAVPVNHPIRLILRAKDVTHSFFVPHLRIKQDTVPGMLIPIHFTPTKVGKYEIACAELCGLGHYKMKSYFEVMTEEGYKNWLAQQGSR